MVKLKIKKTGEVKEVFSAEEKGGKVYVKFSEQGKEYQYAKANVEFMETAVVENQNQLQFKVYTFKKHCYRCQKETEILTYILFADGTNEDVAFPWDIKRLCLRQNVMAHMLDPSIEFYGIKVIGDDPKRDEMLLKKYPKRIAYRFSKTTGTAYPMNICSHCGIGQGRFFVYQQVNKLIKRMEQIQVLEE